MALPFQPGFSFNKNLGKEKYHKSHHFDSKNDVAFMFGDNKCGIGGDPLPGQRHDAPHSTYPNGEGGNQPAWVAFDKQVLSFDAYFQEGVQERREEQYRVRHCKIYFYLEDDSIQVIEPRAKNSGLPQGTLIKRHRIARPAPNDDVFYTVEDLNVGNHITFYNKVFRITGCDEFTHNFLRKLGVKIGLPEHQPKDPYMNHRKALDESMQPLRPYERSDSLRQFIDHDRHVLRFYSFWDDSDSLYGDSREMVIHYFLADDTLEIREVIPANCGRDSAPCFLKRQRLPKKAGHLYQPGEVCDRTVLNVFGQIQESRFILDNLKTGSVEIEFYKDSDLLVGSYINVYGRKFLLCDCDEFTKEYYRSKFGMNEFKSVSTKKPLGQPIVHLDPPYNGWGGEEDSLGNCRGMIPRPPQRDFVKFMEKDRKGLESHVLRFLAHIVSENAIERERKFIVSYFLSDDTVLVFEPPIRNSGVLGGKFLERGRMKLPGQERFSQAPPQYYKPSDFFIGAKVVINKFPMEIEDADEYAFRYMEQHPSEFPFANIDMILNKLRSQCAANGHELRSFFARNDPDGTGKVEFEQLQNLVQQACPKLNKQEITTIARYYADRPPNELQPEKVLGIAQAQLRKQNFELFARLMESAKHNDRTGTGQLSPTQIHVLMKTMKVPLPNDLMNLIIEATGVSEDGSVNYAALIHNIDWRENPIAGMSEYAAQADEWTGNNDTVFKVEKVNWEQLVNDLCGPPQM